MFCKDCKKKPRTRGPRCDDCARIYNNKRARVLRAQYKRVMAEKNDELQKIGKRVCFKCLKLKVLSEFSTSMGNGKGKINDMCDTCLTKMYMQQGKFDKTLNYKYWRRRAYSLNSVARRRLMREELIHLSLNDLPYIFKPQDLVEICTRQNGLCKYCYAMLDATNTSTDHRTPLSRGGVHLLSNIDLVCFDCNRLKFTRTEEEFLVFLQQYVKRITKQ